MWGGGGGGGALYTCLCMEEVSNEIWIAKELFQ